jgi:N-acetyl-gamma-glutamyl-phosphate reductase
MIKAGIIGASGYVGGELARLLLQRPDVRLVAASSRGGDGRELGEIFGNFRRESVVCSAFDIDRLADLCDVIFIAAPHGAAAKMMTPDILSAVRIIDMGADFRLTDPLAYERWYGLAHPNPGLIPGGVYGLCELYRDIIGVARLTANPGCYAACSILTLYPLLADGIIKPESIVIDAKSGVSGAGRDAEPFCEVNESVKAYKVASHRHTPEIEEHLSKAAGQDLRLLFTPHLIPMNRGVLVTCYADLTDGATGKDIADAYRGRYGGEFFIRLLPSGVFPETRWVRGSNFVDIGACADERTRRAVAVGALDNMVKGAAGQAVQNMNIMFGLDEKTGLTNIPAFPG